jgi:hypothetical protein
MAIIRMPPAGRTTKAVSRGAPPAMARTAKLESIVIEASRPAILIMDGSLRLDGGVQSSWTDVLTTHRAKLERAMRGVGRLETTDAVLPFVGTAFVIDRKFAVTANYVAEVLARGRQPENSASGDRRELAGAWLNLKAECGTDVSDRIAITRVHLVHPYWGFAFLELGREVDPGSVLELSPKQSETELRDRNVCVIGYPAEDSRNDPEAMKLVFNNIFGVKRLMPGKVNGLRPWGAEKALALSHDATTTGGTGGAPLIDIESGCVLGVQVGGQYLEANYAVPAWEIGRDPLWWSSLKSESKQGGQDPAAVLRQAIEAEDEETPMLSFDEVLDLHKRFEKIGVTEDSKIALLFAGLPNEYVAALPSKGSPTERLLSMLHAVNTTGGMIGGHSAFYYLLKNGERLRSWDSQWVAKVQALVATVLEREKKSK